ncbi:MAG: DUF6445 family protein [Rudaea sp.]|nr:DUF6445 family protein [Rudaea sp.]
MFNPDPHLQIIQFDSRHRCIVIDDALVDPHGLKRETVAQRSAFRPVDFNAYPGIYLPASPEQSAGLDGFFRQHVRRLFDARRSLHMHVRFSMVTLPPQALRPFQRLCHSDNAGVPPQQSIQACVLYLFDDASLGGTGFYQAIRPANEMSALFNDATRLSGEVFTERYGIKPGYMLESNAYFARVGGVPAKWNRMIFYDGSVLHSGDILAPARLSEDPAVGRLTLNGFFTCSRNAAARSP